MISPGPLPFCNQLNSFVYAYNKDCKCLNVKKETIHLDESGASSPPILLVICCIKFIYQLIHGTA